jgi:hypothetical protein
VFSFTEFAFDRTVYPLPRAGTNDGFVSQNDQTEQTDHGETPTVDDTIGFNTQFGIPYL